MKILITTDWYQPVVNGVVTSVLNLREELIRHGNEVRVLTLSPDQKSYRKDGVYYIRSLNAGRVYPEARVSLCLHHPLLNELAEWKPDVIHSQCEFTTFFYARSLARRSDAPIVHTYHTIYEDYTHYFSPSRTVGRALVRRFSRRVLSQTDMVVAPTSKVAQLLEEYGVEQPIKTVPTGICLDRFRSVMTEEQRAALRQSLGIGPKEKVLVVLGRLAKEKHVEEILGFLSHRRDIRGLIVGDGPYRENLQQTAAKLGLEEQVVFTGMVKPEETADYYRAGDVFVSASNSETQGLTYVEALACGRPAICRKDDCLKDVIVDGENGWQYEDEAQFWAAVDRLFCDPAEYARVSANALETAHQFSKELFGQRIEAVYEEAIYAYQLQQQTDQERQLAGFLKNIGR